MKKEVEVKKTEVESGEIKPLLTCRVLFISVLDKIYLVILGLTLIGIVWGTFAGNIASNSYHFWARVGSLIPSLIGFLIFYLFCNWLYRCAAKTMLCVTENEVYKEHYLPFKNSQTSIPLNKITAVSTLDVLWIFRSVIIHQYHHLPMIFFTWNNHEFKDKVNELITKDDKKIENSFENKNIFPQDKYYILKYIGIALGAIICLVGIVRLFNVILNPAKKVAGTYNHNETKIVLEKNGECNINSVVNDVTKCNWEYDNESKTVNVKYSYNYKSWYSTYERNDTLEMKYDSKNKTITYYDTVFQK